MKKKKWKHGYNRFVDLLVVFVVVVNLNLKVMFPCFVNCIIQSTKDQVIKTGGKFRAVVFACT